MGDIADDLMDLAIDQLAEEAIFKSYNKTNMSEQRETVFVNGLIFKKPHEKAPDFVKGHLSIKADELTTFIAEHKDAKGWLNIDMKKSREGKIYFQLNTFTPAEKPADDNDGNPF